LSAKSRHALEEAHYGETEILGEDRFTLPPAAA